MKAVFYLNDQGIGIYSDHCQSFPHPQFFGWEDTQAIEDWLATLSSRIQAAVVMDLVDEDIAIEASPKLYLWEKSAVEKRLIERLESEGADFVHTQWTGLTQTNPEGRAEELILSASIAAPTHVMRFISALEEAEIIVTGIYSAPFLLAEYFKSYLKPIFNLGKSELNGPYFVISRHSQNTYRQTFFNDGRLRISRLIEIDKEEDDFTGFQSALIHEAKLARNYVYNQNLTKEHESIGYVFLDSDERRLSGLEQRCLDEGLIISPQELENSLFKTMTFHAVSFDKTFCGADPHAYFAEQTMADYLLSDTPKKFYFNDYVKKINNVLTGHKAIIGFNTVVFLILIAYGLVFGINLYLNQQKIEMLDQQIKNHIVEKERLQNEVDLQIDAKEIKASVDFSEAILSLKTDRTVGFKVEPISDVFSQHQHIQLISLEWKQVERFDSHQYEVEIGGWVFPFEEYFRKPVEWVDELIADLEKVPNISQVALTQEPLNRDLKQALSIEVEDESVTALPFKIRMRVNDVESK